MQLDTIVCGNCPDVMAEMPDGCVDLVVTDPPYPLTGRGACGGCTGGIFSPAVYNSGELFDMLSFSQWLPNAYRVLKDNADAYIMINDKNMFSLKKAAFAAGFKLHNILVWLKPNRTPNRWYMKQCEYVLYFWKGRAKTINNPSTSNVLSINRSNTSMRSHPTEKPVELMEILIGNSSICGDLIFDPFIGSGATAVAALKLGRHFYGCDINQDYVDLANGRIVKARLEMAQLSFDITRERGND